MSRTLTTVAPAASARSKRDPIFDSFRRWGYLQADLDPLGDLTPEPLAELDVHNEAALGPIVGELMPGQRVVCEPAPKRDPGSNSAPPLRRLPRDGQ